MRRRLVLGGGGHAPLTALTRVSDYVARGYSVVLISPAPYHYDSGMGPGMLGGTYRPQDIRFHVKQMVEERGGTFISGVVSRIDPASRRLILGDGAEVPYDVVSFNTGSGVPTGGIEGAPPDTIVPVKPIEGLLRARRAFRSWQSQPPCFQYSEVDMVQLTKLFSPVDSLDPQAAQAFMAARPAGSYTLLDVRQPGEYEAEHLPGATLIPLPELSDAASQLDPAKPTLVHCAIGGRSRVAAQLLSGMGFPEVYNIKGGIKAWQGQKAAGPVELNLDLVRGDETPAEVVALAFGLEKGLQEFYRTLEAQSADQELRGFFAKMAGIEDKHMDRLFSLRTRLADPPPDRATYEATVPSGVMEGGFDMQDFITRNAAHLTNLRGALDLAMMIETQALDLYLRFARKMSQADAQDVLFQIAQEEKAHLAALGKLLETRR